MIDYSKRNTFDDFYVGILNTKSKKKLLILNSILEGRNLTINALCDSLNISSSTFYSYINDINKIIYPSVILTDKEGGNVFFGETTNVRDLYANFLRSSEDYSLLDVIIFGNMTSVEVISQTMFLSKSYVYRWIKRFNECASPFGVEIDSNMNLKGHLTAILRIGSSILLEKYYFPDDYLEENTYQYYKNILEYFIPSWSSKLTYYDYRYLFARIHTLVSYRKSLPRDEKLDNDFDLDEYHDFINYLNSKYNSSVPFNYSKLFFYKLKVNVFSIYEDDYILPQEDIDGYSWNVINQSVIDLIRYLENNYNLSFKYTSDISYDLYKFLITSDNYFVFYDYVSFYIRDFMARNTKFSIIFTKIFHDHLGNLSNLLQNLIAYYFINKWNDLSPLDILNKRSIKLLLFSDRNPEHNETIKKFILKHCPPNVELDISNSFSLMQLSFEASNYDLVISNVILKDLPKPVFVIYDEYPDRRCVEEIKNRIVQVLRIDK